MEKLSFVIVGHVDHGKSTLIGRLLYDTNSLTEDKLRELKQASAQNGKDIEFAFLVDHLKEEREQGITIDTTQTVFKTSNREYTIIDAPGHAEFVRNMITGASQAEVGVLIIDASEGVRSQTKRHAYILQLIGIKKVIVAINKMDFVEYKEEYYAKVKKDVEDIMEQLSLHVEQCIPVSAKTGDNVCKYSENMKWYSGKSFLDVLEECEVQNDVMMSEEKSLFVVQDVYQRSHKKIVVGKLEDGILKTGSTVKVFPCKQEVTINTIEKFGEESISARAGECFGLTIEQSLSLERGNVIASEELIEVSDRLQGKVFWFDNNSIKEGEKIIFRCVTQECEAVVEKIIKLYSTETYEEKDVDIKELNYLEVGDIVCKLKEQKVVSEILKIKALGRFVLVRDNKICAGGTITVAKVK